MAGSSAPKSPKAASFAKNPLLLSILPVVVVAAKPDYAEAYNELGVALARKGRLDEATIQFQEALKLRPGYDSALASLEVIRGMKDTPVK